jgi:hypothetical protein
MALNSPMAPAIKSFAPDDRRCTRAAGRPLGGSHPGVGDVRVSDASEGMECMHAETGTPSEPKRSLALGVWVRMSAFGLARHPKYGDRQGLIVGRGSASSWRVKFDERRCIQTIHQDYLEKAVRSCAAGDPP